MNNEIYVEFNYNLTKNKLYDAVEHMVQHHFTSLDSAIEDLIKTALNHETKPAFTLHAIAHD